MKNILNLDTLKGPKSSYYQTKENYGLRKMSNVVCFAEPLLQVLMTNVQPHMLVCVLRLYKRR